MAEYRKKPVVIEAEQWLPTDAGTREMPYPPVHHTTSRRTRKGWQVLTIHGQWTNIEPYDYIVIEPDGLHAYPCKPDIFEATYEPVG